MINIFLAAETRITRIIVLGVFGAVFVDIIIPSLYTIAMGGLP